MTAPQHPVGPYQPETPADDGRRRELIAEIEKAPANLRRAIAGLADAQLDTLYRAWTIRQIVHHIADSHVNAYVRFKLALTEDVPTIKPYQEGLWSELADAKAGDVGPAVALVEAVHARWVQLLRTMTPAQFARAFFHPESGETVPLAAALAQYAWHGRHHTGQITWLRAHQGW